MIRRGSGSNDVCTVPAAARRQSSNWPTLWPMRGAERTRQRSAGGAASGQAHDALFDIERDINGLSAEERLRVRREQSAPLLGDSGSVAV